MKNLTRFFIFVLAFQMEVRVRASGELLLQPTACLGKVETCAIQVVGSMFTYKKGTVSLKASTDSVLVRSSLNQWRLVKGNLWVENGRGLEVSTVFGDLNASLGQYWVLEQGSQVIVRNVNSDVVVTLRDGKKLELPEGFEFWMSGINAKGVSEYGMIRPIDMKEHLPLWNSLYAGSKEDFVKEVVQLRESWGDLVEKSSSIYQSVVMRNIASQTEQQEKIERAKEQVRKQRAAVRELYRKKVFEY